MHVTTRLLAASVLLSVPTSSAYADEHPRHVDNARRGGAWTLHDAHDVAPCAPDSLPCNFLRDEARSRAPHANPYYVAFRQWETALATQLEVAPRAAMQVSSDRISHLDKVAVAYQLRGVAASDRDWIGAYCIDDEASSNADDGYIDWRYTRAQPVGSIEFGPLTNMRCAWQFRFFSSSGTTLDASRGVYYQKLGETPLVRFHGGPSEPQQVHLAMTEQPTTCRVSWTSAAVRNASVWFGVSPDRLVHSAAARVTTYAASDMCGAPATTVAAQFFRDPGSLYDAEMAGLALETTYFYQVGSVRDGKSAMFSFTTPPAAGTQPHATSVFVFGDLGDWNIKATGPKPDGRTQTTVELMRQDVETDHDRAFLAVFHVGDLAYAMGRTYLWDQFASLIEPIATVVPYMVGIGNHEYDYLGGGATGKDPSGAGATNGFHPAEGNFGGDSQGECGVPFGKRYTMPANGNGAFWWSTDLALAHHVMLSSEHDFRPGTPMYDWLVVDLARVNRTSTPWLILHTHRPMYCSVQYPADYKLSLFIRRYLEPLLALFRVDIVFSGHYHSYERTCAVYDGECRQPSPPGFVGAPVHVMVGAAGANVDHAAYYDVPWRAAALMDYGYGRLHIHNATHAEFEFKLNRENRVVDAAWIVSHHNWSVAA